MSPIRGALGPGQGGSFTTFPVSGVAGAPGGSGGGTTSGGGTSCIIVNCSGS